MDTTAPLQPLSGLDAMFLYLETPKNPMHVGSLSILDGSLGFDGFRAHLASRLHLVKSFHQRLVEVPFGLDKPYWAEDPDFDLDRHLHHTALPRPGDWKQLRRLANRVFGRPLDRTRPLWEMVFVEGLEQIPQVPPGSVALLTKIHHAAIDGISGTDILGVLFDVSSTPRVMPGPTGSRPGPIPGRRAMLGVAARQIVRRPRIVPRVLRELARAALRARQTPKDEAGLAPTLPFAAPPTPINASISAARVWNTALLSLDRVKALKQIAGCTVNDVVLAICAGALRRWLIVHDALPATPLVAMVPVSTRTADEKNALGNQISAMFVQLATEVADPIERLKRIAAHTTTTKAYQGALDAKTLMQASELVPFGIATQAARLYSRAGIADLHRPPYNCVITNVPGPQLPLYLGGARLLAQMGMAPILEGMGLIITVTTYDGVMSISPISSPAVMPDLDAFAKMLRESANELEACLAATVPAPAKATGKATGKTRGKETPPGDGDVAAFFTALPGRLKGLDVPADVYQFDITGPDAQRWVCDLRAVPPVVTRGETDAASCTLRMEGRHFRAMADGAFDGTAAFMQGKLKVDGDINAAIGFGRVLTQLSRAGAPSA
ncbi:MAG: wax ester/triacylglycerol synthase family O-acyltransferase [Myxococcota bacterium]